MEETSPENSEVVEEEPRTPPPKQRKVGRPAGSKDLKPRAKRAPRMLPVESVEPVESVKPVEEELPRALPHSTPFPALSTDDRTSIMLELLRVQATSRHQRKVDRWKSFFD